MAENNPPARRSVPWKLILLGAVALALVFVIGTQVIGILYSMIAPPSPPLPEGVKLLKHTSSDYGVDDWLYGVNQTACEVVRFYQEHDTDCRIVADNCSSDVSTPPESSEPNHVAQCVGEKRFSIFAMRWDVVIASGYQEDGITHFRLSREIYWTGDIPPKQQLQP